MTFTVSILQYCMDEKEIHKDLMQLFRSLTWLVVSGINVRECEDIPLEYGCIVLGQTAPRSSLPAHPYFSSHTGPFGVVQPFLYSF